LNQDFPRVYRLRSGWRNTFVVLGALFAIGGLAGAFFARHMSEFFGGQILMAAIFLGFALMGVYTMLGMLRTQVVLHADTIELHEVFTKRSLWRPDIAGRRLFPMQYGSPVIRLEPRSESLSRPMTMPQYLETDAAFDAWLAAIPDIDSKELDASLDAVLEDPSIPGSEDEKLAGLARARRIAGRLKWVALAVSGWVWFYPHPYDLAIACAVVIPCVAVVLAARGGSFYRLNPSRNDIGADLSLPLMTPGFALTIRALFDAHVFDWRDMLMATTALTLILVLVMWIAVSELRASPGNTALLALLVVPYAYGAATLANMEFDRSEPERYEAQVLGSRISRGKSTEYYLKLGPWGPRSEADEVDVGRAYYQRGSRQKSVCVYLYRGAFRIRWFDVWDCPRG
jgi:hypothetical protein